MASPSLFYSPRADLDHAGLGGGEECRREATKAGVEEKGEGRRRQGEARERGGGRRRREGEARQGDGEGVDCGRGLLKNCIAAGFFNYDNTIKFSLLCVEINISMRGYMKNK